MTTKQQKIDTLTQEVFDECQVDFEGLWGIPHSIKWDGIATDPAEIRKITLNIVQKLLEKGIVAGTFDHKKPIIFDNISNDEIIAMIDTEWTQLGREPSIGDIVCFASPELAKKIIDYSKEKQG